MKLFYRISDHSYPKAKVEGATKEYCLNSCLSAFPSAQITVIADNCEPETINMVRRCLQNYNGNIIASNLGNAGSMYRAIQMAVNMFDDTVYLAEDDYIYRGNCEGFLEEGLQYGEYATLFDYIDKYLPPYNGEITKVFRGKLSYWRWSISTTMTFATTVQTLKEDMSVWKQFCSEQHPHDHYAFCTLGNKGRHLCVSLPGLATHTDLTYYSQTNTAFPDQWALELIPH